jgi:putative ABC transport system permease protein
MTTPPLPAVVRWIIAVVAPERWRESLAGDLAEERSRRRAGGRRAHIFWLVGAAITTSVRLRGESMPGVPAPNVFGLTQAVRTLAARPLFTVITLLTLTLGIGANTAVFSLANWLMLRPVPGVFHPDSLVTVRLEPKTRDAFITMTVPDYLAVAEAPGFESVGATTEQAFHITAGGAPRRIQGAVVTSNYFAVLGQRVSPGRAFLSSENDPDNANVAVISDHLWRSVFGAARDVIGQQILVSAQPYRIIGVAAPGFRGPDRSGRLDLWVPLASFRTSLPNYPATLMTGGGSPFLTLIGRLKPGATVEQIREQLLPIQERLAAQNPKSTKFRRLEFTASPGLSVPPWQRVGLRQMFALLLTVSGLLLLLTCANVANLLFTRTHERRTELATRQALGASRSRVVRQLLTEGLLLAAAGGGLALLTAWRLGGMLNGLVVSRAIPALSSIGVDWRVFAFASGISVITCVAAALLPAIAGSRVDLVTSLKSIGRSQTAGSRRVRQALTLVQVTVSVALLAVGALLVRSMLARYHVPLGYDAGRVLAFSIDPGVQGYKGEQRAKFFRTALTALRDTPGVANVGLAYIEPFRLIGGDIELRPADEPASHEVVGDSNSVSEGFFSALGVTFISGRDFTEHEVFRSEAGGNGVVILNESMARKLFGTSDAAGRRVTVPYPEPHSWTVVGVVSDIRTRAANYAPVPPTAYQPFGQQFMSSWGAFHVGLTAPASTVIPRVTNVLRQLDARLPVYDVELLSESLNRELADQRLLSQTIGTFAVIAALLSALGLYGVLSRGVAERRREFGIRAALGASPLSVGALITREALMLSLIGSVAGVAIAVWLARFLESRLFGVTAFDPASLAIAVGIALGMAVLAAAPPARRAASVNVVEELR